MSFGPVPASLRRRERCPGSPDPGRAPRPRSAHTWLRPGRRSALSSPAHLGSGNTTFAQLPAAGPASEPAGPGITRKGRRKTRQRVGTEPRLAVRRLGAGTWSQTPCLPQEALPPAGPAHPQLPWPTCATQ